jgi:hypothetical protein
VVEAVLPCRVEPPAPQQQLCWASISTQSDGNSRAAAARLACVRAMTSAARF